MISSDQRMIETQARHISRLRSEYEELRASYTELQAKTERDAPAASFYFQLQQAIVENPIIQSEWERFCAFLKMADTSFSEKVNYRIELTKDINNIPFMY